MLINCSNFSANYSRWFIIDHTFPRLHVVISCIKACRSYCKLHVADITTALNELRVDCSNSLFFFSFPLSVQASN